MSRSSRSRSAVVAAAGQPLGDRRVDGAAAGVHLADRARELVALGDPVLQQVREAALAPAEQRERVLLVVVRAQDDDAGVGVLLADPMRAVDALRAGSSAAS